MCGDATFILHLHSVCQAQQLTSTHQHRYKKSQHNKINRLWLDNSAYLLHLLKDLYLTPDGHTQYN